MDAMLQKARMDGIWRIWARPCLILLLAGLAACSLPPPNPTRGIPIPPEQTAPPPPAGSFAAFLADFRIQALAAGVSAATYDSATANLTPIARIQQLNEEQPEFSKPVWDYLDSAVSERRVADAAFLLAQNDALLTGIEARYGVPRQILAAIWGMETDFGRDDGGFPLFGALATLAWQGPRTGYARPEFLAALKMQQQENYPPSELVASWAGAFGQTQFTPSTFLKYAVDGDGDGRIDLWQSSADALASTAAMLSANGWQPGKIWGYQIALPPGFAYQDADIDIEKPLTEWQARGVTLPGGAPLPATQDAGAIYLPAGARGPAFLVFDNFRVILKYNNAASYALAVGLLADRARGAPPLNAAWPREEVPLARQERLDFQTDLRALGFDPGGVDGVLGRKTRAALRLYQMARGLPADGFSTHDILQRMAAETKSTATSPSP